LAYRIVYPASLNFDFDRSALRVCFPADTKYNPDLWAVKYLFDQNIRNKTVKVCVDGKISSTLALRMLFLRHIFPHVIFHDTENDRFVATAKDIIKNIGMQYVTYDSSDYSLDRRGTKNKLESLIEKELTENISAHINDFPKSAKVIRQFPANIFKDRISKNSRVTDKLWIDMVSLNYDGELSPIELKVGGNIPLDLFAQGLDYGIYCHLFKKHIKGNWFKECVTSVKDKITIYYIGEEFHPALVGRGKEKGIISLIRKNEFFNIVFVKICVDKKKRRITGKSEVIFDTRKQCK